VFQFRPAYCSCSGTPPGPDSQPVFQAPDGVVHPPPIQVGDPPPPISDDPFIMYKNSVTLKTVFYQIDENIEQVTFREALLRLHTISEDYDLFATQFWDILSPDQQAEFDDVLHLMPTCASITSP
jgi:hypothetical protein